MLFGYGFHTTDLKREEYSSSSCGLPRVDYLPTDQDARFSNS